MDGPGGGPRTASQHVAYYSNFFDITVLHGGRGFLTDICREIGVRDVQLPLEKLSKCLLGFPLLWWHLRRIKPDLVILHGQWAAPLGILAGRLAGVRKAIYICHWPSFYTDWDLKRVIRNFIAERLPCRFAAKTIAISESNRRRYLQFGHAKPDKLVMIPNPVPLDNVPTPRMAHAIRNQFGWADDCCHVVSVGRLTDQKRVDWLVEAWVQLAPAAPQARLWIIGSGPEEAALKKRVSDAKIENVCRFLGSQPNGWQFIAAADIVVMTTIYEARGNVVTEAMAAGKPVVATRADGVEDSFTDGVEGYLVPPANPSALAARLLELIKCPEKRASLGRQGKTSVLRFQQQTILPKYLAVVHEVLEAGSTAN